MREETGYLSHFILLPSISCINSTMTTGQGQIKANLKKNTVSGTAQTATQGHTQRDTTTTTGHQHVNLRGYGAISIGAVAIIALVIIAVVVPIYVIPGKNNAPTSKTEDVSTYKRRMLQRHKRYISLTHKIDNFNLSTHLHPPIAYTRQLHQLW